VTLLLGVLAVWGMANYSFIKNRADADADRYQDSTGDSPISVPTRGE